MPMTPDQIAQKWAQNLGRSGQSIQAGVQAVTESPTAAAARALPLALQNYTEAINSGRTAAALNAVPLSSWQQAMISKGIPRIASGATAAQPKYAAFMQRFMPVAMQVKQTVRTMPKGTLADAQARMAVAYQAFKQFAGKPAN